MKSADQDLQFYQYGESIYNGFNWIDWEPEMISEPVRNGTLFQILR